MEKIHRGSLLLILVALYLVPVLLLTVGVIPFALRFHILILNTFLVILLVLIRKDSLVEMGINKCNWKADVLPYLLITLPLLLFLALGPNFGFTGRKFIPASLGFYLFYVFISSPFQEFLYRAVMRVASKSISDSPYVYVFVSALLYSLLHLIYKDVFTLALTFVIGTIWAAVYWKHPNLIFVSISHAVLGFVTIWLGLT